MPSALRPANRNRQRNEDIQSFIENNTSRKYTPDVLAAGL